MPDVVPQAEVTTEGILYLNDDRASGAADADATNLQVTEMAGIFAKIVL